MGERIGNMSACLDPDGHRLDTVTLPGDGWRTQHEALKWRIADDARKMGARMETEVYGLFAVCIPQVARSRFDVLPVRKRQGLVPDFLFHLQWDWVGVERPVLLELKTLNGGTSTYPVVQERCAAVERRAAALPRKYSDKARRIDQGCCDTEPGQVGPVKAKFWMYAAVRGSFFGPWGEASADVDQLSKHFVDLGVRRHRRTIRARDDNEARAALTSMLWRQWAITAVRKNERLLLTRLRYVGRRAGEVLQRCSHASEDIAARARRAACLGVRSWHD